MNKQIFKTTSVLCLSLLASVSNAVPVLQIGPSDFNYAEYNLLSETWDVDSDGSGGYSFNAYNTGEKGLVAYLVFAATPESTIDNFDITVTNDNVSLSLYIEGYGAPPFEDPNSLSPHDIYDTWSEVYQLVFNGTQGIIPNTQPDDIGTGNGYVETVFVDATWIPGLDGIHVDMYTAEFDATKNKDIVTAFAPYSHDGQLLVSTTAVPVPAATWLFTSGLIGMVGLARRKKTNL